MLAFDIWIEKSNYRSPLPYYHWNLSISRPDRIMNRLAMKISTWISRHRRQHAAHRRFVLKFRLLPLPLTCLNTFTNLSIDLFRIYFPKNVSWCLWSSKERRSARRFKTSRRPRHCTIFWRHKYIRHQQTFRHTDVPWSIIGSLTLWRLIVISFLSNHYGLIKRTCQCVSTFIVLAKDMLRVAREN